MSITDRIATLDDFLGTEQFQHDTYNGGHLEEATNKAFHHGMTTVFNILRDKWDRLAKCLASDAAAGRSDLDPIRKIILGMRLPHGFCGPTSIIALRRGAGDFGVDLLGQVWILEHADENGDFAYEWRNLEWVSW